MKSPAVNAQMRVSDSKNTTEFIGIRFAPER
jgi:hypothetical protein